MTNVTVKALELLSFKQMGEPKKPFLGSDHLLKVRSSLRMKGNRVNYEKYTYYMISREHYLFSYTIISNFHSNQAVSHKIDDICGGLNDSKIANLKKYIFEFFSFFSQNLHKSIVL